MFCVKERANTQTGFKRSVFKLICGGFWKTPLFYSSHSWFWWEYVAISILFCPRPSLALCSFFSSKSDVSLEETVFRWPVHSKLDQVVPCMCAPCMGDESSAMCFHLQNLLQTFFTHWRISVRCCSWKTKGLVLHRPGSWGITWKLWVLWPFISLGVIGHNFGM